MARVEMPRKRQSHQLQRVPQLFHLAGIGFFVNAVEKRMALHVARDALVGLAKEQGYSPLLARGMLGRGSAIGFISSAAGLGWEPNLPLLKEYLDISDFDAAAQWAQEQGKTDYMWSKQAICAYVAREAMSCKEKAGGQCTARGCGRERAASPLDRHPRA